MTIYALDGQAPEFPEAGTYWVADTAVLIGKVRLKHEASIWFGAVVRGDNEWIELGERSQIQDNATLHTDPGFPIVIGSNCVIGHNVIMHGACVDDNSLIGMGAILLNGVKIGKNCLVGRRFEFVMLATILAGFWSLMSGTVMVMALQALRFFGA